jgi:hypothetical protein
MITLRKAKLHRKIRDCFTCADQHYVDEMYPQEGNLICEYCLMDSILEGDE